MRQPRSRSTVPATTPSLVEVQKDLTILTGPPLPIVVDLRRQIGHLAADVDAVGGGHRGDAGEAEFVDEAILQGAVDALTAAAGRGRIAEDVLDAEASQGAADLSQPATIRGAAR